MEEHKSKIGLVAAFGLVIAGLTFLGGFITTQRASTPTPRQNVKIEPMKEIPRPTLPPLRSGQAPVVFASPETSPPVVDISPEPVAPLETSPTPSQEPLATP